MTNKLKYALMGILLTTTLALSPLAFGKKASQSNKIVLNSQNAIALTGEINGELVADAIQKMQSLDQLPTDKPIYLYIYSPGGSIQDGLELIEAASGLRRPVHTITSFAASMAFQTVQQLGERYILKSGVLMSHRAAGQFQGSFGGARPSQIDSRYGFWSQRIHEMDEKTVERTKGRQTLESYLKAYRDEVWLTGPQSVDQGYADKIVNVQCDSTLVGTHQKSVSFFGMQISFEVSNCPLVTSPLNVRVANAGNKMLEEEIKNRFLETFDLKKFTLK